MHGIRCPGEFHCTKTRVCHWVKGQYVSLTVNRFLVVDLTNGVSRVRMTSHAQSSVLMLSTCKSVRGGSYCDKMCGCYGYSIDDHWREHMQLEWEFQALYDYMTWCEWWMSWRSVLTTTTSGLDKYLIEYQEPSQATSWSAGCFIRQSE